MLSKYETMTVDCVQGFRISVLGICITQSNASRSKKGLLLCVSQNPSNEVQILSQKPG